MLRDVIVFLTLAPACAAAAESPEEFFETRIRPVLVQNCFKCHGGEKTSSGLRVDSREALLKGGEIGASVVPGKPNDSLLIEALRHGDTIQMPPDKPLPQNVVDDFVTWVEQGAFWPESPEAGAFEAARHWAFQPVATPTVPEDPSGWSDNPVDRFVAARHAELGLARVAHAEKPALLRRVTFDLVGLPPTPNELDAFLADSSPEAFPRVVDRLLASPQYGERWGRHWMDIARYADTAGDNADYPIPEIARYRDYIIDSFNNDKPYDEFVREQLAGDILAEGRTDGEFADKIVATGYLALSRRYATAPYELWHLTLEDTIDTVGRSLMGLTFRCARCHDHKFDPITTADYYALYGIFSSTQFPFAGSEEFQSMKKPRQHFVPLIPAAEMQPHMDARLQRIAELQERAKTATEKKDKQKIDSELRRLERTDIPLDVPQAYAVREGQPADVSVQIAGDPANPGPVAPRAAPAFLATASLDIPTGESGRRQFAEWLTSPQNPLFARVMVNRIWQYHFGKGIVASSSNFGMRGSEPTHPELLDFLASRFVEGGWSIKAMHRLIVLSKTYQLSSSTNEAASALDPANSSYWRFDRRRLEAEGIRDSILAVSGKLDDAPLDVHPFPPFQKWNWTQHTPFKDVYPSDHRSVYLMTQRIQRHPFLDLFDAPDTNATTDVRTISTVPLQALFLMNNEWINDQADAFASRLLAEDKDDAARVDRAYRLAYARAPKASERDSALEFLNDYRTTVAASTGSSESPDLAAWRSLTRVIMTANEFVYID